MAKLKVKFLVEDVVRVAVSLGEARATSAVKWAILPETVTVAQAWSKPRVVTLTTVVAPCSAVAAVLLRFHLASQLYNAGAVAQRDVHHRDVTQSSESTPASTSSAPSIAWPRLYRENEIIEQERKFFQYYKEMGWATTTPVKHSDNRPRSRVKAHNPRAQHDGETYFYSMPVQSGFGADVYDEDYSVYTGTMAVLPAINAERRQDLDKAREALQKAEKEAKGTDKDRKVKGLRKEIRRLEAPLVPFVPPLRADNGKNRFVDTRKTDPPKDIMANNAPRDTMHKFKPIINGIESVSAFGQEIVVEDSKNVTINRKWKEGDT